MKTEIVKKLFRNFENIKKLEDWVDFWSARSLQFLLWYVQWRNFEWVIDKARISCKEAWNREDEHFAELSKQIILWKWAMQNIDDYKLSRYSCYLIAQNWNVKKQEIA